MNTGGALPWVEGVPALVEAGVKAQEIGAFVGSGTRGEHDAITRAEIVADEEGQTTAEAARFIALAAGAAGIAASVGG